MSTPPWAATPILDMIGHGSLGPVSDTFEWSSLVADPLPEEERPWIVLEPKFTMVATTTIDPEIGDRMFAQIQAIVAARIRSLEENLIRDIFAAHPTQSCADEARRLQAEEHIHYPPMEPHMDPNYVPDWAEPEDE